MCDLRSISIEDLNRPHYYNLGEVTGPEPDEIPVCWGCGVTPQAVAMEAKVPFIITHYGGCMFLTDRLADELAVI